MKDRLKKLREKLDEKELDGMFISQEDNRRYLSGFIGSAGYLLITAKKAILATDFRYTEQAEAQAPDYEVFQIKGKMADWFAELTGNLSAGKLGFEEENVSYEMYREMAGILKKKNKLRLVAVKGVVESLRMVKDREEIELIARAAEIADLALEDVLSGMHAGTTEREIAWELEKTMRERGSEALPFEIIVACGANAALPHAQPSGRKISENEPIVIDMGARVGGYCSDMTRTICLNTPPSTNDKYNKVYNTVLKAQLRAIETIKEGMTGEEADGTARRVIEEAGFGEAFGHSLGHGVGLAVHEMPTLSPRSTDILADGMVFSIEPGIYLSGWGGVRIEDLAVMENGRVRILSKAKK